MWLLKSIVISKTLNWVEVPDSSLKGLGLSANFSKKLRLLRNGKEEIPEAQILLDTRTHIETDTLSSSSHWELICAQESSCHVLIKPRTIRS